MPSPTNEATSVWSGIRRPVLAFALLCHLALASFYLLRTPAFEGPDEADHWFYAFLVADSGELPIANVDRTLGNAPSWKRAVEGHSPPLYYLLLAAELRLLGASDTTSAWRLAPPGAFHYLHGFDERAPVSREIGLLRLMRVNSVVLGLVSLILGWLLVRTLVPARPRLADATVLAWACLPQWSFLHGVLHADALAICIAHAGLLVIARIAHARELTLRAAITLGVLVGAGVLTKLTTLFLAPVTGLLLAYGALRWPARRATLLRGLLLFGIAATLAAPWVLRNLAIYGEPLALHAHDEAFASNRVPAELLAMPWVYWREVVQRMFWSFCGNFGWYSVPLPGWLVASAFGAVVLAVAGWLVALVRRSERPTLALGTTALGTVLVIAAALRFNAEHIQPQGRFLFPAAGPLVFFVVAGLAMFCRRVPARTCTLVAGVCAPGLATWVALAVFAPAFAIREGEAGNRHASLVERLRTPAPSEQQVLVAETPAPDERCATPATFRFRVPASEPADARYSIHAWLASGRVVFATAEWFAIELAPGEFTIPQGAWEQLPVGEPMLWKVRRIPDRARGEATRAMPESPVRAFVRVK